MTPRVLHATRRRVRRVLNSGGARETGLARLMEIHGTHMAGDALVAVSLAGTLFFAVPIGEARSRVALYLLITMLPFALLAPVIGPLLDRLHSGRRLAVAATLLGRALLAWQMAAVGGDSLALYPLAFGVLALSRSYGVARSAMLPRVLPPGRTLVSGNARVTLAGTVMSTVAAPVGAGVAATAGPAWSLRLAAVVFALAVLLVIGLPAHVEGRGGLEGRLPGRAHPAPEPVGAGRRLFPARVRVGLQAAAALRGLVGFLTLFLAFLLRVSGSGTLGVAAVIAAFSLGGLLGTVVGARLPERAPELLLTAALSVALVACGLGALAYSLRGAAAVALVAGFAAALGKLALDASIQQQVVERRRASAFGRSETTLQLAWVAGGGVGIAVPANGNLGFGLAAGMLAVMLVLTLRGLWRLRGERRTPSAPGLTATATASPASGQPVAP